MPPRLRTSPMTGFHTWLVETRGVSSWTAGAYVGAVRGALDRMDNVRDARGLRRYAADRRPAAARLLRAAWAAFRDYAITQNRADVATIDDATALPVEVVRALGVLTRVCDLSSRTISRLSWSAVTFNAAGAELRLPGSRLLPLSPAGAAALRTLQAWGAPADGAAPLLPTAPGSGIPRSPALLRAELDRAVATPAPVPTGTPRVRALPPPPAALDGDVEATPDPSSPAE